MLTGVGEIVKPGGEEATTVAESLPSTTTSSAPLDNSPDAAPLSAVRRLRHRHIVDRLDYLRGLRRLAGRMTQSDLAKALGLTQPSISSALKSAAKIADPPPGFSGASVYEIAQRFTAGELHRDELIDQLSRWPAAGDEAGGPRPVDSDAELLEEMGRALRDGLLDDPTYHAVLGRRTGAGTVRGTRPAP